MKRIFALLALAICCVCIAHAQMIAQVRDKDVDRRVEVMDIEGKLHQDVVVTTRLASPEKSFRQKDCVRITVRDASGRKIYRKTLSNCGMVVAADGSVFVGQPNFNQVVIRPSESGSFNGIIRLREGVYQYP